MKIPKNFLDVAPVNSTENTFAVFPPGAHLCEILDVCIERPTDKDIFYIMVDCIEEGEFYRYFSLQYDESRRYYNGQGRVPKWRAEYHVPIVDTHGGANKYFVGLLNTVARSNPDRDIEINPDSGLFDERQLIGCKVGCLFRIEEFWNKDKNRVGRAIKIIGVCSPEEIPTIAPIEPKLLKRKL